MSDLSKGLFLTVEQRRCTYERRLAGFLVYLERNILATASRVIWELNGPLNTSEYGHSPLHSFTSTSLRPRVSMPNISSVKLVEHITSLFNRETAWNNLRHNSGPIVPRQRPVFPSSTSICEHLPENDLCIILASDGNIHILVVESELDTESLVRWDIVRRVEKNSNKRSGTSNAKD